MRQVTPRLVAMLRRTAVRGLFGLLVVAVVCLGVLGIRQWPVFSRAWRYDDAHEITGLAWYEPRAAVAAAPIPLSVSTSPLFAKDVKDRVIAWAGERNTQALVVMHRGEVVWEHYIGGSNAATRANAQSMTKTVVALLLGIAIAEGKITSVDERVAEQVPEWSASSGADADDLRRLLTYRDLLQMVSGLRRDDSTSNPFSDLLQMHLGADAAGMALSIPAVAPARRAFSYNNVNTQVIGVALERATGMRLPDYLAEKLWRPLGAEPASWWLDREGGMVKAYCCLLATPRDWARVGQLMLDRGRVRGQQLVPSAWIEQMLTPSPQEPDYGLHVWLGYSQNGRRHKDRSEPFVAPDVVWLDGRKQQRVYVIRSQELVIVRVGERATNWDEAFLPNAIGRGLPSPVALAEPVHTRP